MILAKLGGSVITEKSRPMTPRPAAVRAAARELARSGEPAILVHGGGSFGHYWSVRHDMHTRPGRHAPRAVSDVKNSMVELDRIVLRELAAGGLAPYSMPPAALVSGRSPQAPRIREAARIAASGLVPVTYGDALWSGGRTYIMSGDRLMTLIAAATRPRLCIFALAEDGLYRDTRSRELLRDGDRARATVSGGAPDVTGGMARKVREARAISRGGVPVVLLNGNRPRRISEAVAGRGPPGTYFGGAP